MQEPDPPRTLVFHPHTRSVVYFGPFRLDLSDGLLTRDGTDVRLPPRALTILQHLVERSGRIVSKQSLMDVAWREHRGVYGLEKTPDVTALLMELVEGRAGAISVDEAFADRDADRRGAGSSASRLRSVKDCHPEAGAVRW